MIKFFKTTLLLLMILTGPVMLAQNLVLTSGNREKKIQPGRFVQFQLPFAEDAYSHPCQRNNIIGRLEEVTSDSVRLKLYNTTETQYETSTQQEVLVSKIYQISKAPYIWIAKQDIHSLTKLGKNKPRESTTGQIIGGILSISGLTHLASAPFFDVLKDSEGLILAGVLEFCAGVLFISLFDQKELVTNQACRCKKPDSLIWTIQ